MDEITSQVLTAVKAAIAKEKAVFEGDVDWYKLRDYLKFGILDGMSFSAVLPKTFKDDTEASFLNNWKQNSFQRAVRQMASVGSLYNVLKKGEEAGAKPVIFKGIVLASLYPEPFMRFSSDADIYVTPSDRKIMEGVFEELGYKLIPEVSKEHVPHYVGTGNNSSFHIDLHDCLWEDYEGKQAKLLDSLKLTDPDTFIEVEACGIKVRTLGITEHLIFQVFHVVKHFATEGLPLRFVTDLALYSRKYADEIDWKRFWSTMMLLKYDVFYKSIMEGAKIYLGIDADIKAPENMKPGNVELLFEEIVAYGHRKSDNIEHYFAIGFISGYFMRNNTKQKGRFSQFRARYFPSRSELKEKYGYAKKHGILLPIAWIHRLFGALRFSLISRNKGIATKEVLEKANERVGLMSKYGLLEEKGEEKAFNPEDVLVSVVIPTYATSDSLKRALDSILSQTHTKLDIIVVDDDPADSDYRKKAESVMDAYKYNDNIHYIKNPQNLGGSGARNVGIEAAKGDYIAFLDDDDYYYPTKIEKQLNVFLNTKFSELALVYCDVAYEDNYGRITYIERKRIRGNSLYKALKDGCIAATSQWLVKKKALLSVGCFTILPCKQDSTVLLKLLRAGYEVDYVPEILSIYHDGVGEVRISLGSRKVEGELTYANACRECYGEFTKHQRKQVEFGIAKRLYEIWAYKANGEGECKKYLSVMRKSAPFRTFKFLIRTRLRLIKRKAIKWSKQHL